MTEIATGAVARADEPVLEVQGLGISFPRASTGRAPDQQRQRVVADVELALTPGRTLALVGESGSGKSATALAIMRLLPAAARIDSGRIVLAGRDGAPSQDLLTLRPEAMRRIRGGEIAMIFQEPMTSLNPVLTIGEQIAEAAKLHPPDGRRLSQRQAMSMAAAALEEVGIVGAADRLRSYPHEFSGGMRQRVMIAMALACRPRVLLADEPTTALDVTIQAQVLETIRHLKERRRLAILLITHDLGVVAENADDVSVMYGGRIVEQGTVSDVLRSPIHPYTRALLACRPRVGERRGRLQTVTDQLARPGGRLLHLGNQIPGGAVRHLGTGGQVAAWWPFSNSISRLGKVEPREKDDTQAYRLVEIEPGHRVAISG